MKFRGLVLFIAGLLVGGLVVPAAAQTDPAENQLVIRSDGFIFLVRSGQRHLVSPVALSDDEINGLPEGEPYLSGLVPVEAMSAAPSGTFGGTTFGGTTGGTTGGSTGGTTGGSTGGSSSSAGRSSSSTVATPTATPRSQSGPLDASFKAVPDKVKQNDTLKVTLTAPSGATCEGKIQFKGGKTEKFNTVTASKDECKQELDVPDDARTGDADLKMVVKKDGQSLEIETTLEVTSGSSSSSSSGSIKLEWKDAPSSTKQGETLKIKILTEKDAECEAKIEFKGGEEEDFDNEKAGSKGECEMEVEIPSDAKTGTASIKVLVKKDKKESEDERDIDVKKK